MAAYALGIGKPDSEWLYHRVRRHLSHFQKRMGDLCWVRQRRAVWNPDSGQRRTLPAARPTSNLVLGPDGTSIIFGTADGTIELWDIRTEQRLRAIKIPGGKRQSL